MENDYQITFISICALNFRTQNVYIIGLENRESGNTVVYIYETGTFSFNRIKKVG